MRRAVAASIALSAVFALAGCAGLPAGTDGNLTNGWPAMPQATITVPVAGACYLTHYLGTGSGDVGVVPCATQTHYVETAYVGAFTGADAQRSEPPAYDSPALPGVYPQCQKGADDYLGGDWHTAYVELGIVVPEKDAWRGGARWFRCDLTHISSLDHTTVIDRGVLKGDLAGPRATAIGCVTTIVDKSTKDVISSPAVDCASPHMAEFAGSFTAPDVPFPSDKAARNKLLDAGCRPVVATFLGFSDAGQWQNTSVGWWPSGVSPDQWKLGDRVVRCFAYAFTRSGMFVGSVKGIKNQAPKG
jgi:hypothetical protein